MNNTFLKAREFMYRNARPLDLARFQYHFENGTVAVNTLTAKLGQLPYRVTTIILMLRGGTLTALVVVIRIITERHK